MDQQQVMQAFGHELRKARNAVGVSQEKLALQVGLDRTYISMLERGLRQPSLTTIFRLCEALEIDSVELVAKVKKKLT